MKIKRILKITFFIIGIVFSLTFLINGINRIIYKSVIPKKYQYVYWDGVWKSSEFSFISGKMMVDLPYKLPLNVETNVDMVVYYNLWSFYHICGTKEFSIRCFISDDKSTSGDLALTDTLKYEVNKGKNIYFSAKISSDNGQTIDYNGVINTNGTKIAGGYISKKPDDFGVFELRRI